MGLLDFVKDKLPATDDGTQNNQNNDGTNGQGDSSQFGNDIGMTTATMPVTPPSGTTQVANPVQSGSPFTFDPAQQAGGAQSPQVSQQQGGQASVPQSGAIPQYNPAQATQTQQNATPQPQQNQMQQGVQGDIFGGMGPSTAGVSQGTVDQDQHTNDISQQPQNTLQDPATQQQLNAGQAQPQASGVPNEMDTFSQAMQPVQPNQQQSIPNSQTATTADVQFTDNSPSQTMGAMQAQPTTNGQIEDNGTPNGQGTNTAIPPAEPVEESGPPLAPVEEEPVAQPANAASASDDVAAQLQTPLDITDAPPATEPDAETQTPNVDAEQIVKTPDADSQSQSQDPTPMDLSTTAVAAGAATQVEEGKSQGENEQEQTEQLEQSPAQEIAPDTTGNKKLDVLTKLGMYGLGSVDENAVLDVARSLTPFKVDFITDTPAGAGGALVQDSQISYKSISAVSLKPFAAETATEATDVPAGQEIAHILYSSELERMRHFLKEPRAHIFFSITEPFTVALLAMLAQTAALYPTHHKPIIVYGAAAETFEAIKGMLGEAANHVKTATNANELVQALVALDEEYGKHDKVRLPRVIDRRVDGDERDFILY